MPNFLQSYRKNNETVMRNGHECWLWPKMDPFLGPFCPNNNKYEFFEKIWISQILASIEGPTSCKVTEKSNGTVLRNGHECWILPKMDPFSGPFCPNKGKYEFFEKIGISQILASMDAQLPAKLQKRVMEQSWGMSMNVDFYPKWTLFWVPFAQIRANTIFLKKSEFVRF